MKFENRHLYLGGSDFGAVLGVNPHKSTESLALEKAQVLVSTFEGNEFTERGELLEDTIIKMFEIETGKKVTDQQKVFTREATNYTIALKCHVDGMTDDGKAVFEAKTTDAKGKIWDDGIPKYYQAQLEMNCYLSKTDKAYIAVGFCNGNDIVDFKWFEFTPQMQEEQILKAVEDFTELVNGFKAKYGVINNGEVIAADIDMGIIEELESIREKLVENAVMISPLEKRKKQIETQLKEMIGKNAGIENEVYKITLGNRVTTPKNELSISRCGIKVEYKGE